MLGGCARHRGVTGGIVGDPKLSRLGLRGRGRPLLRVPRDAAKCAAASRAARLKPDLRRLWTVGKPACLAKRDSRQKGWPVPYPYSVNHVRHSRCDWPLCRTAGSIQPQLMRASNVQVAADVPNGDYFSRTMLVLRHKRPLEYVIFAWSGLVLRALLVHFGLQLRRDLFDAFLANVVDQEAWHFASGRVPPQQLTDTFNVVAWRIINLCFAKLNASRRTMVCFDRQIDMPVRICFLGHSQP